MSSTAFIPHVPGLAPSVFISQSHSPLHPTRSLPTRHALSTLRPNVPTMILGRIFAPSTRSKSSEAVPTVETPAPISRPSPLDYARAHPLQATAALTLLFMVLRRLLPRRSVKSTRSTSTTTGITSSTSSPRVRAVPRKHETTDKALDLLGNTSRKYIIVGGKGGVGKTSMSAAVATAFADRGQTTLIVSTDPAHSLSDAFGQSVSGGDPVPVMGIDNLYAQEVDPDSMKRTFKMMQNLDGGAQGLGMGMDDMGLDELNSLFETIPPGFDEAVALVEIVKYIEADEQYARFERIVFDTAPTGHTLRLLALPDFLNGFFGKIISMKSKFGNVMNQLKGMFGNNDAGLDDSVAEIEELKRSMSMVRDLFRDEIQTEFIVATIPNMMAISESQRLVQELQKEAIPVRHLFVNQVQPANDECTFCATRYKEQSANMKFLEREMTGLQISTVQSFDKEIQGAAALRAMGAQLFPVSSGNDEADKSGPNSASREGQSSSGESSGGSGGEPSSPSTRAAAELVE